MILPLGGRPKNLVGASWSSMAAKNGVLVLGGYGIRVAVRRRHLVVEDGIGRDRRLGRFSRATAHLRRVVILGRTGAVSLESLRWLRGVGAGLIQIDRDGEVFAAFGPTGVDDARLRRAQALAVTNGVGLNMARELVRRKMMGQVSVLDRLPGSHQASAVIRQKLDALDRAPDITELRVLESAAAAAYWQAWEKTAVRFVRRDESRVPDHWRTFGPRGSPLANGPRQAVTPANAILNYLYAILEAETRIAALTMGLDPGLGVLHADQRARDSLALDLIEPIRPEVDTYVLGLLQTRVFRASDFFETRQGVCRVLPPLTHELAETATQWAKRVAPVAEWAAAMFTTAPGSRIGRVPTLLTQDRRSAGRGDVRRNPRKQSRPLKPALAGVCHSCGAVLQSPKRSYCDDCLGARKAEGLAAFRLAGSMAISRLVAEGRDTAHGGNAGQKRSQAVSRQRAETRAWDEEHPRPKSDQFVQAILPGLKGVSLRRIMRATGLSLRYCSLIRRGIRVPHPRHWEALKSLGKFKGDLYGANASGSTKG